MIRVRAEVGRNIRNAAARVRHKHGRGQIKLSINGQKILELSGDNWRHEPTQTITLNKGKNKLLIEYTSPESGDAFFRLYWSSSEFPPEPIPPTVFTHGPSAELEMA